MLLYNQIIHTARSDYCRHQTEIKTWDTEIRVI